jgi:hypothetical protein
MGETVCEESLGILLGREVRSDLDGIRRESPDGVGWAYLTD